ncbi:MAG: DUF167 family protein [Gammaproteobacteria bacterium]|jgi:uncharacterized protein (TIGR00251 family)
MEAPACRWQGQDLTLALQVQPRAARDEVTGRHGDRIRVRLTAPPLEGKANAALIEFLAEVFDVPKRSVTITAGHTSRRKTVVIHAPQRIPEWLREFSEG